MLKDLLGVVTPGWFRRWGFGTGLLLLGCGGESGPKAADAGVGAGATGADASVVDAGAGLAPGQDGGGDAAATDPDAGGLGGSSGGSDSGPGASATGGSGATGGAATGGGDAGSDATGGSATGGDSSVRLPDGSLEYKGIVNLVNAQVAADLDEYLGTAEPFAGGSDGSLHSAIEAFYELYDDDYDFLFFMTDHDVVDAQVGGLCGPENTPPLHGTGRDAPHSDPDQTAPPRLKASIGINVTDLVYLPPFAHEMLHVWANYLDPALGFGVDAEKSYGGHWGMTGVHGQLGGFDPDSLRCEHPAGASPPNCTPESSGRYLYSVDAFYPSAYLEEGLPYAPLELYLMGLIPPSEVPDPIPMLSGAVYDVENPTMREDGTMVFEGTGIGEIRMADILQRHGEGTLMPESERHFAAAFVLVSAQPAAQAYLDAVATWAAVYGGDQVSDKLGWISFSEFTGGRATLSWRIGEQRDPNATVTAWDYPFYQECDPKTQNCGEGEACYGITDLYCSVPGPLQKGEDCLWDNDCAAGMVCSPVLTTEDTWLCAPYCHPDPAAADACDTLCPDYWFTITHPDTDEELGYFCMGGAGGACDPLAQDCPSGQACAGVERASCQTPGELGEGAECDPMGSVCQKGLQCIGIEGASGSYCQRYCDPSTTAAANAACDSVCPNGSWPFDGYGICIPNR